MNYTNQICPVCNKKFTEDDDIAVCPECGTPHHRECYLSVGHCANSELHKTGFSYNGGVNSDFSNEEKSEEKAEEKIPFVPNLKYDDNEDGDRNDSPKTELQSALKEVFTDIRDTSPENILIDGKPATLFEAAIGKNQNYYVPRFMIIEKTKKSITWNLGAFFFPLAWAFYRKMYKLALMILALNLIITVGSSAIYFTNTEYMEASKACMDEDPAYMMNIELYNMGRGTSLTANQAHLLEVLDKIDYPIALSYAFTGIRLAICVVMGLFATKLYKDKLENNIDNALAGGMAPETAKGYLFKRYSVLPMAVAVIIAFFEWAFRA